VPRTMTVVALTHAPPSERVVDVLRELGVDYVLTGHAHSNRIVDHDGVVELNTEPFLMGGLDFTPAGYRVLTLEAGRLSSIHRTTVDEPLVEIVSPVAGACTPAKSAELIVAAEIEAAPTSITARVDCATPVTLRPAGGWNWRITLPVLAPGPHGVEITATSATGTRVTRTLAFEVCAPPHPPPIGSDDWPQVGGGPSHLGARPHEIAPPLVTRWTTTAGGHVLTASPVIASSTVYVATTDLADGNTGGVSAFDLATGALRWRVATPLPVRGGLAVVDGTVVAPQIDGVVVGIDTASGAVRWRHELSPHYAIGAEAGASFAPPATDGDDVLVGHQRALVALSARSGSPRWSVDPVPEGRDSQTAAALAIGHGIAVGTFNRAIGGLIAFDLVTGKQLWSYNDRETVAINASPVIAGDSIFVVSGADEVTAFDHTGQIRWRTQLDDQGFEWGNATIGTPAYAQDILVVPTLYRDLVALDASTGVELWRYAGTPGPLRTTHYRSGGESGFAAAPVITGDIVWAADTAGELSAFELRSGRLLWHTSLHVPMLAGLAISGDWLVAASYDGTVRALVPTTKLRAPVTAPSCTEAPPQAGCCDSGSGSTPALILVVALGLARKRKRRR
jgi:outer membrane protein assembly factor BamB